MLYYWRMNKTILLVIFLLSFFCRFQQSRRFCDYKEELFHKTINRNIVLDGVLKEEAWNAVEWGGDFIQHKPNEGKPPSQQTNFKILYDEKISLHRFTGVMISGLILLSNG
jgi:hypothetical protein